MTNRPQQVVLAIDGDPFRYRVGFAAETPVFDIVALVDDAPTQYRFERTTKRTALENFTAWQEAHPNAEVLDCVKTVKTEPEEYARQMLRRQVSSVIKEVRDRYGIDSRDLRVDLYLSAGTNYRDKLATLKKYKGNRDALHKPVLYPVMTDELKKRYKVIEIHGHEADDAVSIAAAQMRKDGQRYVIASIDKDLDQIPGTHYDYMKKVFYDVTEADARRWFWQQILSGDGTDNIGGACKIGPKKAEVLIGAWEDDHSVGHGQDGSRCDGDCYSRFMWERVRGAYRRAAVAAGCYYTKENDPALVALENARLVYLQQEPGELWTPEGPKQFMKLTGDDLAS